MYWGALDLRGVISFPSAADGGYILSALMFIRGMYYFSSIPSISRIQMCNFALITSATAFSTSILLLPAIEISKEDTTAIAIAVSYPVFSSGVAAFGLVSLLLYIPRSKRFAGSVLFLGIVLQACADHLYGLSLLSSEYDFGDFFDPLWVVGFACIAWAPQEQLWRLRNLPCGEDTASQARWQNIAEAFVPATAVVIVVGGVMVAGLHQKGEIFLVILPAGLAWAGVLCVREYWALRMERDLTRAAEDNRKQLASVLESTTDNVLVLDRGWNVVYLNRRAAAFVDASLDVGSNLWARFPAEETQLFGREYKKAMRTQKPVRFESFFETKRAWIEVHAYPAPETLTVFFRDITDQKRAQDELAFLAHHDPLTGLDNRRRFGERLDLALASASKRQQVALLYLDLDEFKGVNDTFGHPVGDNVLKTLALRLRSSLCHADVIARLGGDEFAVIRTGVASREAAEQLATDVINIFSEPCDIDGQFLKISTSIGVVLSPQDGVGSDELLSKADMALYSAKAAGRTTFRFFQPEMAAEVQERQSLKADLRTALENNEFFLEYQPIINLENERIAGFEALLRWRNPKYGLIPPQKFIPLIEETGEIVAIGDWVMRNACLKASCWPGDVKVAVNLSAVQFRSTLPHSVALALSNSGLSAERLELEITESVLLHGSEAHLRILHDLRALGVRIAMDDFGTGFSSLSYLSRFPFDKIKIDRSFIVQPGSRKPEAIVGAIVGLGRNLGMTITAEGVETSTQLAMVREKRCHEAQGYFFGAPMLAENVLRVISDSPGQMSSAKGAPFSQTRLQS
ncbi:putative bifunctional diguanylate cyclase/phosphodiesterase [Pseudaminobacter sp. NGMCC 1.201702]|uniref:putative bifunctional diguanylate cyclase/phosphodiesterase n=1 Tax=Pseudaminobacter sp. NGMCC 1.201702 TaxID=3391825 RepID=UPI0039F0B41F